MSTEKSPGVAAGSAMDAREAESPGGAAALLRRGGQDASRDLDFHSKRARELWEATCIGKLDKGGRGGGLAGWLFFD